MFEELHETKAHAIGAWRTSVLVQAKEPLKNYSKHSQVIEGKKMKIKKSIVDFN